MSSIPRSFTTSAEEPGRLVELVYDTYESETYEHRTRRLRKRAIVYLPSDYDDDTAHDVFYLMYGGWGDETTTLGTPDAPSTFKNVLDNAIAAGEIDPLIVVCPTYNNTSPDDSADFSLALTLTENYHNELLNDLIPAVEGRYSTYAESVSSTGLEKSRDHRGFGGFSMGAVTTWRTFHYCLDFFRHFLPMSCGTSLDMDDIVAAARTRDPSDYFVAVITGSEDFAHPDEESRVTFCGRHRISRIPMTRRTGTSSTESRTVTAMMRLLRWSTPTTDCAGSGTSHDEVPQATIRPTPTHQ